MRQFDALVKRYLARQEREDFRAAQICSTLANIYRDPKKKAGSYTPKDFMP
ncbi:MAG: DUF4035 domain-containing protein [Bacillota bacterium]|jgi:hypothetical protein